ncbi:hypothetical protein CLM62_37535 [Streptomyces sp. SA15]|nr:hypothetical protein CLM62_37535 [Streptomyces sp. SA15]
MHPAGQPCAGQRSLERTGDSAANVLTRLYATRVADRTASATRPPSEPSPTPTGPAAASRGARHGHGRTPHRHPAGPTAGTDTSLGAYPGVHGLARSIRRSVGPLAVIAAIATAAGRHCQCRRLL